MATNMTCDLGATPPHVAPSSEEREGRPHRRPCSLLAVCMAQTAGPAQSSSCSPTPVSRGCQPGTNWLPPVTGWTACGSLPSAALIV
jgi:hypothetical protein